MVVRILQSLVVVACSSLACTDLLANDAAARLQGIWFGDGPHPLSRTVLVVDGERFIIVSPLGAFVSEFTTNEDSSLYEIDLDRFDGKRQLGVFELSKNQLWLKLGEPNKSRPSVKDVRFPSGKPHYHTIFKRNPTRSGLDVLAKHSDKTMDAQN